jgi:hypothetical protein
MTEDGMVFLSVEIGARQGRPRVWKIYELDRGHAAWVPVQVPGDAGRATWGAVYGTDGNMLALSTTDRFAIKFFSTR